jgi:hypothetical protein
MSEFLDGLARSMASPIPRSRALRLVGGALVSAAVPSLRPRFAWGASKRALGECDAPGRCTGMTTCGIRDPNAGPSPIPVCIVACCDADHPNCCPFPGNKGPINERAPGLGSNGVAPYGIVACCAKGYGCGPSPATPCVASCTPITNLADCPKSKRKQKPPPYEPEVNGCGPKGGSLSKVIPDSYMAANFKPACDEHDRCYGTCNSNRNVCDRNLRRDMQRACDEAYPQHEDFYDHAGVCHSRTNAYYNAVNDRGNDAFETAQKEACDCCP